MSFCACSSCSWWATFACMFVQPFRVAKPWRVPRTKAWIVHGHAEIKGCFFRLVVGLSIFIPVVFFLMKTKLYSSSELSWIIINRAESQHLEAIHFEFDLFEMQWQQWQPSGNRWDPPNTPGQSLWQPRVAFLDGSSLEFETQPGTAKTNHSCGLFFFGGMLLV